LAEDHPSIREDLRVQLELVPGVRLVAVVANGTHALNAARQFDVDVLLLDQNMPGLLGSEVAERLYDEGSRTPIVLLSAEPEIAALRLPPTVVRRLAKEEPFEVLIAALNEASDPVIGGG
jgi:DNA-binding NarL/FixJ family response regulator